MVYIYTGILYVSPDNYSVLNALRLCRRATAATCLAAENGERATDARSYTFISKNLQTILIILCNMHAHIGLQMAQAQYSHVHSA